MQGLQGLCRMALFKSKAAGCFWTWSQRPGWIIVVPAGSPLLDDRDVHDDFRSSAHALESFDRLVDAPLALDITQPMHAS